MMKIFRYIVVFVVAVMLQACGRPAATEQQKAVAERTTQQIISCIATQNIDSLQQLTFNDKQTSYYIFNGLELVFWSDNRLNIESYTWSDPNIWHQARLANSDVLARWERWGHIRVLALIPTTLKDADDSLLADTFSYLPLRKDMRQSSVSTAFQILTALCVVLLLFVLFVIFVEYRTGRKSIQMQLQCIVLCLSFAGLVCVSNLLGSYSDRRYAERQQNLLHNKCLYIQSALQNIYYWEVQLPSSVNMNEAMNVELHDLAHTYGVDINVYNMQGRLLSSSAAGLFKSGFMSSCLAPEILFSQTLPQDEGAFVSTREIGGTECYEACTAFLNGQNVQIGYISVPLVLSREESEDEKNMLQLRLLPLLAFILFVSVFLYFYLSRAVFNPLSLLRQKMSRYRFGKADNLMPLGRNDETGAVVEQYNSMVQSLDVAFRKLISSERDSAWRTMARQIAHEINNPLTPMKLTIQQLQRTKGTDRFDSYFDRSTSMLLEQMDTLSRIAASFSTFAKMPDVAATEVDVAQKLTAAIQLFAGNEQHIPIRYVGANSGVMAWADNEQILEVFTNLIKNALQALEDIHDGDIIVMLHDGKDEVCITVSDNGHGIAEDIRDRIFTPNFTTKTTGTGLGLAISKNIVEGSEGRISFETSEKGTKFFVYLKKTP